MSPRNHLHTLQQLVTAFSLVERNHLIPGTERHETDVEHSFSVAMLAWFICDKYNLPLNREKVLKYALSHDFVEVYAGDVSAFASPQKRQQKMVAEAIALKRLTKEFSAFPDLVATLQNYEKRRDDESLFVWTVDKLQALILGDIDGWRPFARLGITYSQFCDKHADILEKASPYMKDIYVELLDYYKTTYYDKAAKD